jgi:hypothetical protein
MEIDNIHTYIMLMKYFKSAIPNIAVRIYEIVSYKINVSRICFKQEYNNNNNNNRVVGWVAQSV